MITDILVAWGILFLAAFLLAWLQGSKTQGPASQSLDPEEGPPTPWWPVYTLHPPRTEGVERPMAYGCGLRRRGWPCWPRAPTWLGAGASPIFHPSHLLVACFHTKTLHSMAQTPPMLLLRFQQRSKSHWIETCVKRLKVLPAPSRRTHKISAMRQR